MEKKITVTAAFLGMTAIILGAFGAHALKTVLTMDQLATFETGVKYQMYHALFLMLVGLNASISEKTKRAIYFLTVIGVVFFSGSIYLLATNQLTSFDFKVFGIVTPIGGLLLILAWSVFLLSCFNKKA
jgi:uncharacterized membrane protein YgdD (TMEM256/DUF423 family)